MNSRVGVIIPSYNGASLLAETLGSALAQGEGVRVYVMDDGSTDGTRELVEPYLADGRVSYSYAAHTGGPVKPRNRGLAAVTAPFVVFLDADDLMVPGYLARALPLLEAHPEWGALVGDYRNFTATGDAPTTHFASCRKLAAAFARDGRDGLVSLDTRTAKSILVEENFQITGSVLYRTEVVRRLNGCDEALRNSEDFDLLFRTTNLGAIGVSTGLALRRRLHGGNVSNQTIRILGGKALVRTRLRAIETDPSIARKLDAAVARFLDGQSAALMTSDRRRALGVYGRAVTTGLRAGAVPTAGARAFVKSLLTSSARPTRI